MERKFSDIQLEESYQQCHKGQFFLVEEKRYGKNVYASYKIVGFDIDLKTKECKIFAQRINRRTGKMSGKSPILEIFDYAKVLALLFE